MESLKKHALHTPDILLPAKGTDLWAWAVIACDQYTQNRAYWQKVADITRNKRSTLHIIFPEIYLHDLSQNEKQNRAAKIRQTMADYLKNGVFAPPVTALIYTERKTSYGRLRKGLIACIDLEDYDWRPEKKAKIRASEATILERIPPRVAIRDGAPLETPHIMLLVNDPERLLVEKTGAIVKEKQAPVYSTDLMMNSGSVRGWQVSGKIMHQIAEVLTSIEQKNRRSDGSVFMFAVGDGNHSLATAKTVWEKLKKNAGGVEKDELCFSVPKSLKNHPSRFALVEIVNLYDPDLTFEPIHRVLFNVDPEQVIRFIQAKLGADLIRCKTAEELTRVVENSCSSFGFMSLKSGFICLKTQAEGLAVSALQPALDAFINTKTACIPCAEKMIDYIHGADEVFRLAKQKDCVAIMLPPIAKDSFFETIEKYGSLPRKSFSMGEASEKRFYFECRRLM